MALPEGSGTSLPAAPCAITPSDVFTLLSDAPWHGKSFPDGAQLPSCAADRCVFRPRQEHAGPQGQRPTLHSFLGAVTQHGPQPHTPGTAPAAPPARLRSAHSTRVPAPPQSPALHPLSVCRAACAPPRGAPAPPLHLPRAWARPPAERPRSALEAPSLLTEPSGSESWAGTARALQKVSHSTAQPVRGFLCPSPSTDCRSQQFNVVISFRLQCSHFSTTTYFLWSLERFLFVCPHFYSKHVCSQFISALLIFSTTASLVPSPAHFLLHIVIFL